MRKMFVVAVREVMGVLRAAVPGVPLRGMTR